MALVAPDTNPDVKPTPVKRQGSLWVAIGGIVGLLLEVLPVLPPLPEGVAQWLPAIGVGLAYLAHLKFGPDEYEKAPEDPPKEATP